MDTRVTYVARTALGLTLTVLVAILLQVAGSSTAFAQGRLELCRLETVDYGALPSSSGNVDRPSIAVRSDGQVRIAITDYESGCCSPIVAPLKVATRRRDGEWTFLTVTNFGDHPTPHFLPGGNLGILYMDYGDRNTLKFARVSNTEAKIESVYHLGLNPGQFEHLAPWSVRGDGEIQAVTRFGLRFRRTSAGWSSVAFPATSQDVALAGRSVLVLGAKGVYTFANGDLATIPSLVKVPGGVQCCGSLVLDKQGRLHTAYVLRGNIRYGFLSKTGWKLEIVSSKFKGLLNDQALIVDGKGRPYTIFQNSSNRIVIATKRGDTWFEQIDLGQGMSGNMVLGPSGDEIHATFTSTVDGFVRYAKIRIDHDHERDDDDDYDGRDK
jgi:hypothetical protein